MEDAFWIGASVGAAFVFVFGWIGIWAERRILVEIGKKSGVEKLADGNFYYIIPERKYLDEKQEASNNALALAFVESNRMTKERGGSPMWHA